MALLVNPRGRVVAVASHRVPRLLKRGFTRPTQPNAPKPILTPEPEVASPPEEPARANREPPHTRLPRAFPARAILTAAGYGTIERVRTLSLEDLQAMKGIGPVTANFILAAAGHSPDALTRARKPRPLQQPRRSRMNPDTAADVVLEAVTILTSAGAKAWMQDGTLLGAVREGNVLSHDADTDVGVMHDTWTPGMDDLMLAAGFKRIGAYNTPDHRYHQKWRKNAIRMCVFHYYRNPDGSVYHGIRHDDYVFTYPHEPELAPISLSGRMILAPAPPEAWLETKYGPDWRTPKRAWDCRTMPANSSRTKP